MNIPFMRGQPRFVVLVGAAAIATCAVIVAWIAGVPAWGRPGIVSVKDEPPAKVAEELMKPGPLPDIIVGKADAPVTIVEYADLSCPHCAAFHANVLPLVMQKYVDTGKARLVMREFPLNVRSLVAFMSVRCAPLQNAVPLLSALFSHQEDWLQATSAKEQANKLFGYVQQVGISRQAFDECVPSGDELSTDRQKQLFRDVAAQGERAGKVFNVHSTPTFFVNGQKLHGATIEDFDKAIEQALSH